MNKEINIAKIKKDAYDLCFSGKLHCSESVVYSIRDNIAPEMPEAFVSAVSGFPGGVGGSECMCGAVTGSVSCLGYFFGRVQPTTPTDPKSQKCITLAYELQDSFKKNHKVLCCHVHLKDVEFGSVEQKAQCSGFSGEMAAKLAEIIAREHKLKVIEPGADTEKGAE